MIAVPAVTLPRDPRHAILVLAGLWAGSFDLFPFFFLAANSASSVPNVYPDPAASPRQHRGSYPTPPTSLTPNYLQ
jgi:hypothetical protein